MDKDRFWHLLAKVKAGEASPEDQLELNHHLAQHPDDMDLLRMVDAFWEIPFQAAGYGEGQTQQALNKLQNKLSLQVAPVNRSPRSFALRPLPKLLGIAAILLSIVGGSWLWNGYKSQEPLLKNTVSTKNGSKSKVEMPDGTQIWLNVGSRIEYDENYGKENREITLSGEAYFDVAHDENKPFIIHTPKLNVKVLGTVFNVKAYAGDEITEATLIKGRIEVTFPGRPMEKLILKPTDKITVSNKVSHTGIDTADQNKTERAIQPEIVFSVLNYQPADSVIIETAWVQNKFIFRSKKFEDLYKVMERWFGITILVHDSVMLEEKFTGTFNNESITGALDALQLSYPFQYKYDKNNNTVTIDKK